MTRAQIGTSPAPSGSDGPAVLRSLSGPAVAARSHSEGRPGANDRALELPMEDALPEPSEYFNKGVPHVDQSPVPGAVNGSSDIAIPGKPTSPQRKGVLANGLGHGDVVTPLEAVSPGRRSVQFARADMVLDPPSIPSHTRTDSWDGDLSGRSRSERFVSKLKSLAVAGPSQTPRPVGTSETPLPSTGNSPVTNRSHRIPAITHEEGSDADVDESDDEEAPRNQAKPSKRKRMKHRLKTMDLRSSQSTPKVDGEDLDSPSDRRFRTMIRRSTMPDATEQRGGLSEGEGRDQLDRMRRGSSWLGRSRHDLDMEGDSSQPQFPGHRRRISDILGGGGVSDGDGLAVPRRPLFASDRATTFGAQTWKQLKSTFKALGGGRKPVDRFDYYKSAELMAELRAVTPAVVMLASMLQRDEHGYKRIPVLLEQLKLRIIDSQPDKGEKEKGHSERHSSFTFRLEYGSGPSQMSWTIERTIYEIAELHGRYKLSLGDKNPLQSSSQQRHKPKQPHFPRSVFPYLRSVRGIGDVESDEEERAPESRNDVNRIDEAVAEATAGEMTAAENTASEMDRPGTARRKKSRVNLLGIRRQSSGLVELAEGSTLNPRRAEMQRAAFIRKQRTKLEKYLQEMIHWLMFRADANRLCRFLELSALGVRLAPDGSYHGKECFLHIQSAKGVDFRRALTPSKIAARHSRKWFLVRESYIVVAESPSTMEVYDVYLVDPTFQITTKSNQFQHLMGDSGTDDRKKGKEIVRREAGAPGASSEGKHHRIKLETAERNVKLYSRKEKIMEQFFFSVKNMLKQTLWAEPHRFGSFAPVRNNVFAQFLVDGRDYMWMVSRAISMAQDVIYIHDWWLSPELYMRRPAVISEKWRLDRLLKRKAQEGVKIFVIVYRNVEQAVPIDSEYTKYALHSLHPNILVQRSPNQFKKNQFFFAHHEKICIVDHDIAFLGGIDLCFGRWDTPQHGLTDDRPTGYEQDGETPKDADHCQLWPGKDYSNPRVLDFFRLRDPYEEMYDRSKVPRMPWHDVSMQVVGQPARDLTRHFVQRWNYLRRERNPTRPMPFLLPPPDAKLEDLKHLGLTGTCEVQILRSAGDWSLGLPKGVSECSILTAYISLIKQSEHFVYIENQFFITSTETLGCKVVNGIGDAFVERIIRAHENDEDWRCCIMIPLMPGFQNTVKQDSGSSVRLIMQFQYRSICRGPHSIFGRLRARNIDPEEYISFFSLRQWGVMENGSIVTEQLYIHAKTIIVDDRAVLIGSANINERSMLGIRDSEVAALVRDTKDEWITMAGKPYRVGAFAHALRMRLMREHLGLDVDAISEQERQDSLGTDAEYEAEMSQIYQDSDSSMPPNGSMPGLRPTPSRHSYMNEPDTPDVEPISASNVSEGKSPERRARAGSRAHASSVSGARSNYNASGSSSKEALEDALKKGAERLPPPPDMIRRSTAELGLARNTQLPTLPVTDDTDIGGPPLLHDASGNPTYEQTNPLAEDIKPAVFDKDTMRDPLNPAFWDDVWTRVAENNTKLYRRVFRCMPDSEVLSWKEYNEYDTYAERFNEMMTGQKKTEEENEAKSQAAPPGSGGGGGIGVGITAPLTARDALKVPEKVAEKLTPDTNPEIKVSNGDAGLNEKTPYPKFDKNERPEKPNLSLNTDTEKSNGHVRDAPSPVVPFPAFEPQIGGHLEPQTTNNNLQAEKTRDRRTTFSSLEKPTSSQGGGSAVHTTPGANGQQGSVRRRRRATTKGSRRAPIFPYEVVSREMAKELCELIQGHVVQFPYDWLETEEDGNHWLYQPDMLAPKEI